MAKSSLSIDFKSSTFYALKLVLHTADTKVLIADLNQRVSEAGDFYSDEAIVLDASNLTEAPDWDSLIKAVKANKMYPAGLYINEALEASCANTGLAILDMVKAGSQVKSAPPTQKPEAKPQKDGPNQNAKPIETTDIKKSMVIKHPLRSGQSIYAKGCDLIVIGMVSKGAEVIADGNIHIYGPLRGKAIAGAQGDTKALILTTQLDAELLAIAGVYRVIETDLPNNLQDKAVKIELAGDTLKFQSLN